MKNTFFLTKKLLSVLCAAVLVVTSFSGVSVYTTAESGENLLVNGDFSDYTDSVNVTGWLSGNDGTGQLKVNTNDGTYLEVKYGKTVSQTVDLLPYTEYSVEFSARFAITGGGATVSATDSSGATLNSVSFSDTVWQTYRFDFKTGADGSGTVINLKSNRLNFRVSYVALKDNSLLVNGSAEAGNADGWTSSMNNPNSIQSVSVSSLSVSDDSYISALGTSHSAVNEGGNRVFQLWGYAHYTQNVELKPNTAYALSAYIYEINNTDHVSVTIKDTQGNFLISLTQTAVQSWRLLSDHFTTGDDGYVTIDIYSGNPTGYSVYMDNINIFEDSYIVKNGGFNQGVSFWEFGEGDAVCVEEDGINYLNISSGKTVSQSITLKNNTEYRLKFNQKSVGNQSLAKIAFGVKSGVKELLSAESNVGELKTEDFIFKTSCESKANIYFTATNANCLITNVVIEEVPGIIINGDAETGLADGWSMSGGNTSISLINSSDKTTSGDFDYTSLASIIHRNTEECGTYYFLSCVSNIVSQKINLEPNNEYILRIKYFTANENSKVSLKGGSLSEQEILSLSDEDWTDYSLTFTSDSSSEFTLEIYSGTGGCFAFDNVSIVKTSEAANENYAVPPLITEFASKKLYAVAGAENCFASGDFEAVPTDSWNQEGFIDSGILAVSDEKSRGGSKSLKVTVNSSKKETAVMWLKLEKNTDYIISMSLLGEFLGEDNLGDMSIQLVNDRTGYAIDSNINIKGIFPTRWDSDWHRRAVEFNTGDADMIGIRISAKKSICYIDDIVVCKAQSAIQAPQAYDKQVDPMLALSSHKQSSVVNIGNDIISCSESNNLIKNGSFSADNLLINGDFSDYTDNVHVTGWLPYNNGTGARCESVEDGDYLEVWWGKTISQTVNLAPNTEYTVEFTARLQYSGNECLAYVSASNNAGAELSRATVKNALWDVYRFSFTTGEDGNGTVINLTSMNPNFYVRSISLIRKNNGADVDVSFWDELTGPISFIPAVDGADPLNKVVTYSNDKPHNYNAVKYVDVKPNTRYVAYVRLRAQSESRVAFTLVTGTSNPKPLQLVQYTPQRNDGAWEYSSIVFDTNDDTKIGVGLFDGGGSIVLDDFVLCEYDDAVILNSENIVYPKGDVNRDGILNACDLVFLRGVLLEVRESILESASDINADGDINILDLVVLKKLLIKKQ